MRISKTGLPRLNKPKPHWMCIISSEAVIMRREYGIKPDAGDKETMTQLSKEAVIVRSALEAKGLETPMLHTTIPAHEKKLQIEQKLRMISLQQLKLMKLQ